MKAIIHIDFWETVSICICVVPLVLLALYIIVAIAYGYIKDLWHKITHKEKQKDGKD